MPFVTWSKEYSVNVEIIDKQHQKLLELVNGLHAAVESCIDKQQLREKLAELVEFTGEHFATEEEYMRRYGYPAASAHQKEHKELLRHLNDLLNAVSGGFRPTFYSDYDVSTDWALLHIAEHDKGLGAFLNSKNVY